MAKIDDGSFGFRSRTSIPQAVPPGPGEFDTSGTQNLVSGVREVAASDTERLAFQQAHADAAMLHSRALMHHRIMEDNRARSAAALVDYDLGVKQAGQSVTEDLQSGKISREDVAPKFSEAEGKVRASTMQQIPPEQQDFVAPRLAKAAEHVQFGLGKVVEEHRKGEMAGHLESIRDGMQKLAVEPDADLGNLQSQFELAAGTIGPSAGIHAKVLGKAVQDFKDATTSSYLVARLNERLDDMGGLRELKGMVGDTKAYPHLDGERRNVLLHSVNAAMMRLEAKAAADQARVLAELSSDMQNTEKAIVSGHEASPELMLGLEKRAKGTPLQGHFESLNATNAYIGQFTHAPLAQAEGALLDLQTRISKAKSPGEMSGLIAMSDSLTSFVASKKRGLHEDGYGEAVKSGTAPYVALDFTSVPNLEATMRSRVVATKAQAAQNPGASQGILLEGEARSLRNFVETQAPEAAAEQLGLIARAINDPVVLAHSMKQVVKDGAPELAHAGFLMGLERQDAKAAAIALLEGRELLSHKDGKAPFTMPTDQKFDDGWRSRVGNAYEGRGDAEKMDFNSAKAIYAKLMKNAGKTTQTDVNSSIWKEAITMSTGGLAEHNGKNVILPYGVDETEFRKRANEAIDRAYRSVEIAGAGIPGSKKSGAQPDPYEGLTQAQRYHLSEQLKNAPKETPDIVTGGQLSRDFLKDQSLESIGQGQYRVHEGTASYVVNDEGYPLVLDLRKAVPSFYFDIAHGRVKRPVGYDAGNTDFLGNPTEGAAVRGLNLEGDARMGRSPLGKTETGVELSPETAAPLDKPQMKRDRKPPKGAK